MFSPAGRFQQRAPRRTLAFAATFSIPPVPAPDFDALIRFAGVGIRNQGHSLLRVNLA
jgi:hypothetical protein